MKSVSDNLILLTNAGDFAGLSLFSYFFKQSYANQDKDKYPEDNDSHVKCVKFDASANALFSFPALIESLGNFNACC